MPGGGSKPGERRGGRKKGTKDKKTLARIALLDSSKEIFERKGYNPIEEAVDIAQRAIVGEQEIAHFAMHMALAKKHYGDISAVQLKAEITDDRLEQRLNQGHKRRTEARNGHSASTPSTN